MKPKATSTRSSSAFCATSHASNVLSLVPPLKTTDHRKSFEEPIHIVGLTEWKEPLTERDPGHLRVTDTSGRRLLADISERLLDHLLGLRVEHAPADRGDGTSHFGVAAPFQ